MRNNFELKRNEGLISMIILNLLILMVWCFFLSIITFVTKFFSSREPIGDSESTYSILIEGDCVYNVKFRRMQHKYIVTEQQVVSI